LIPRFMRSNLNLSQAATEKLIRLLVPQPKPVLKKSFKND